MHLFHVSTTDDKPFHLNLRAFLFFIDSCSDEVYLDALKVQGSRVHVTAPCNGFSNIRSSASVQSLSRISRRRKPASHGRTSSQQRTKLLLRSTDCTKPSKQKPAASGIFQWQQHFLSGKQRHCVKPCTACNKQTFCPKTYSGAGIDSAREYTPCVRFQHLPR